MTYTSSMSLSTLEKEAYLKELVEKLLKDRNLSDFEMLDNLFKEIKRELQNTKTTDNESSLSTFFEEIKTK